MALASRRQMETEADCSASCSSRVTARKAASGGRPVLSARAARATRSSPVAADIPVAVTVEAGSVIREF